MDDHLRSAIDRLVKDGGRLTIDAPDGASSVVLQQPGSRFGILEVNGRLLLRPDEAGRTADLQALGWTDPTVTHRLGREIRLPRADPTADGLITLTQTWRVPPSLSVEIADAVSWAVGEVARVDLLPLTTRGPTAINAARSPRPPTEELDLEAPEERRTAGRTVPAPLKGLFMLALIGAVAFAWAGMIRGAPRLPSSSAGPSQTSVSGGALVTPSPTPAQPTATRSPSPTAGIRPHLLDASTEVELGPATAAVDGNPMTAWRAAFGVPQWIEIGLDAPSTVREVVLFIAQAEKGASRHMIQVAVTGQPLHVVGVVDQPTKDGDAITFRPETPIENVERIRIETLSSPSNAGWYEVIVR